MKKRQKSKMTMLIVGGLAAVSLVSVGFANWVVTGQIPDDKNVTVTVGDVENQSLATTIITDGVNASDLSLNFDNTTTQGSNKVFSGTGSEDMSFSITFKIDGKISEKLASVKFEFDKGIAGTSDAVNPLSSATKSADYLTYPWLSGRLVTFKYTSGNNTLAEQSPTVSTPASVGCTVVSSETNTLVCTATFTFGWGKAFLNRNPSNTPIGDVTDDNDTTLTRADLLTRLDNFSKAFKTFKDANNNLFNVKVTPVTK